MGTLQLQFMPYQPSASRILLRHMVIHSFTSRWYPKVRVWTCPAYHVRNKHICPHFPFWGRFSYTWWEAVYCCCIHLHLPSWHTSSAVLLWWKKRKLMIYLPDTPGPQKRLVKKKLTYIWGSRSERGKKEKNGSRYLIQNQIESHRVSSFPQYQNYVKPQCRRNTLF